MLVSIDEASEDAAGVVDLEMRRHPCDESVAIPSTPPVALNTRRVRKTFA
jgi:hypothetical protein